MIYNGKSGFDRGKISRGGVFHRWPDAFRNASRKESNDMKKRILACVLILSVIFLLPNLAHAQKVGFRLKLKSGMGMVGGGDINLLVEDMLTRLEDYGDEAERQGFPYELTPEDPAKMRFGLDLGAEAIVTFGAIGIGLGMEFLNRSVKPDYSVELTGVNAYIEESAEISFNSLAFTLNVYGFFGKGPLSFYAFGGPGLYLGKGKWTSEYTDDGFWEGYYEWNTEGNFSGLGIGLQAGLGIEFELAKNIALFLEGGGRLGKIKNFSGDMSVEEVGWSDEYDGDLWYYELEDDYLYNKYYAEAIADEDEPSGSDVKNARPFEFNFSGFSIKAGVCIKF